MSSKETISIWFEQYGNDVYRYLVYYTGKTDVEDLVQDVFVKALKGISKFQQEASPKTWLFSIARNLAIDEMRSKKKKLWATFIPLNETITETSDTPELYLEKAQVQTELHHAIQMLNKTYRDVIILRAINELSVSETAQVLNWSEAKVSTNYYRALKALSKVWRNNNEK
jgi:RNA polymerase sigma-70 factor, ECF subfamily